MATHEYLVIKNGFVKGNGRVFKGGQTVRADDPDLKGFKDWCRPLDETIERATAAPGERRITPPRGKKTAAKKTTVKAGK